MTKRISLTTNKRIVPMVYAYTTPGYAPNDGWVKIGYAERQTVLDRIRQQTKTVNVQFKIEWSANALFEDGKQTPFSDRDFHRYLIKRGVERRDKSEWFKISPEESKRLFNDFRDKGGVLSQGATTSYELRNEQEAAVSQTLSRARSRRGGQFLWNAKPRFGKTLAVYDLIQRLDARNVLVLTNRPAVANSWYDDYEKFLGTEKGWRFVSRTDALADRPLVMSADEFDDFSHSLDGTNARRVEFVSLQDLKGADAMGGEYVKLEHISKIHWDLLVVDEAHEGVDTYKTEIALDFIDRDFTLHLSGTPFKAIANDKFLPEEIFNWTYADEQRAKRSWETESESESRNPYADLPQLWLYAYQMSEIVRDELEAGYAINDDENVDYAFDLNEFFKTQGQRFVHEKSVDKFLDALTRQEKFPFSTPELRDEIKHSFWLLDRVDSAKALAKKLKEHPVFKDYEIIVAAGDGKLDSVDAPEERAKTNEKAINKVRRAVAECDKTITLSVGQLTTGVTVPEWSAVLMLANVASPALYMQTAFRAQNPRVFRIGAAIYRKERAHVFDFDPARSLTIYETFANDLASKPASDRDSINERRARVREALNFFPIIGEDDAGEMIPLDAEKVLSIPRKIRSRAVVESGFRSNFLFQNIGNVFSGANAVLEILKKFQAVKEKPLAPIEIDDDTKEELQINDKGEVEVKDEIVIGAAQDLLGGKVYENVSETFNRACEEAERKREENKTPEDIFFKTISENLKEEAVREVAEPLVENVENKYGAELNKSDQKRLKKRIDFGATRIAEKSAEGMKRERQKIEREMLGELSNATTDKQREEIARVAQEKIVEANDAIRAAFVENLRKFQEDMAKWCADFCENQKRQREKEKIESSIKDRLRGFARSIPCFLMAYGSEETTLESFDQIVPPDVFLETTGVTLDDFRLLRDGGDVVDDSTGETKRFDGNLFDPVVFNDSVKEFFKLKRKLADYFRNDQERDIFDYIPPQRTNQIFTPKKLVVKMVDMLEAENPGCFERDDQTFADLYMKSGQYVAEIVKRLFRSEGMKRLHPNEEERLRHIFAKQVYGLAPSGIIYNIAKNYVLGFDGGERLAESDHNLRELDALKFAKDGTLAQEIDKLFG